MTTHRTAPAAIRPGSRDLAVREARKLVAYTLDQCRHSGCEAAGTRADDVLLVVSELVTNACRHAGGANEVRVWWERGELLIEVEDASGILPREPAQEAKGEDGGYGCQLVTALADHWGAVPHGEPGLATSSAAGKTVYAGFALD